mgnify:CR=1 FL=1
MDEKTPHIHCVVVPLVKKLDKRTNTERYTISKKQFIHDYKANSGSGIIVKTAGFPITNGRMRDSLMLQRLNRKMIDVKYTKNVRITHDYNGDVLFG